MPWASYQIGKIVGAHGPGMPGTFSPPPWLSDPDMHHGTCVTHVPWCMPGSLTSGFLWIRRQVKTFSAFPVHAQPTVAGKKPTHWAAQMPVLAWSWPLSGHRGHHSIITSPCLILVAVHWVKLEHGNVHSLYVCVLYRNKKPFRPNTSSHVSFIKRGRHLVKYWFTLPCIIYL